jgi:tRNA 2-thiouridine synthesizing protein B
MLFTINYSMVNPEFLDSLLKVLPKSSPILFYEDGVYACKQGTLSEGKVSQLATSHPVYALDADLKARGISDLVDGIKEINYDEFVGLVEVHNVVPWLRN